MSGGDAVWIRELVDAYQGRLLAYAERIVGDEQVAQDVVQDVFLKLCEQDDAAVKGYVVRWLYVCCRNRALDVLKRRRRWRLTPLGEAAAGPDPAAQVELDDEVRRVLDGLTDLTDKQAEALLLRFQGGLDNRDIALVMDTSPGNVAYLVCAGLKVLRRRLGPPAATPEAARHPEGGR